LILSALPKIKCLIGNFIIDSSKAGYSSLRKRHEETRDCKKVSMAEGGGRN